MQRWAHAIAVGDASEIIFELRISDSLFEKLIYKKETKEDGFPGTLLEVSNEANEVFNVQLKAARELEELLTKLEKEQEPSK